MELLVGPGFYYCRASCFGVSLAASCSFLPPEFPLCGMYHMKSLHILMLGCSSPILLEDQTDTQVKVKEKREEVGW